MILGSPVRLKLASCMAENSEGFCRARAKYIAVKIGITAEYVDGIPWQERERLFDRGEIQLLWICGLPYVQKADSGVDDTELLAVPVPVGERYQHKPVYFSDVVVRSTSPYRSFLELRGARGHSTNRSPIPVSMWCALIWRSFSKPMVFFARRLRPVLTAPR